MSVINQVLNQLEQRGVRTAGEQTMVRAVPDVKRRFGIALLVFCCVVLVAGIAVWRAHKSNVTLADAAFIPEKSSNSPEVDKLAQQHEHANMNAPVSKAAAVNPPASRLSLELSPVPSTLSVPSFDNLQDKRDLEKVTAPKPLVSEAAADFGHAQAGERNTSVENSEAPVDHARLKSETPLKNLASNASLAVQTTGEVMPMKRVSTKQQADAEFHKAAALMQQGHTDEAIAGYETVLLLDAGHDAARQALAVLLLESKRGEDAERILLERLQSKPDHAGFAMMLARLQVERGAVAEAVETLKKALPYAISQADYHAFLAALLQRQNRNDEAIEHYQNALRLAPDNGIWLMGYGISLRAMQRNTDAKNMFKRALGTQTLSPELRAFVQQKLKEP